MPGVNRWILEDDDDTKVFAFNPVSMTTPFPQKNIIVDATSHPRHGIAPTIKNPTPVQEWKFSGNIYTDTEKNLLLQWHNKDTSFKLTDHLLREWIVLSVHLDINERRPSATNSTKYTYEWTVLNLGRA